MMIFEDIECPLCPDTIKVIIEENKIVSHGVCPTCDNTFSAERLQFVEECQAMEDEFMNLLSPDVPEDEYLYHLNPALTLIDVDIEVEDFYNRLIEKGVKV
jgi:hypothetical protein